MGGNPKQTNFMFIPPVVIMTSKPLSLGSVYEPLKSIHLPRDGESLWNKLDHYYRISES